MARRPKKQSLIDIAITGSWLVLTILASILFIVIYIIIPSVTNPILKPIALGFRPLGLFLLWGLAIMALVKLIIQSNSKKQLNWIPPSKKSPEAFNTAMASSEWLSYEYCRRARAICITNN